jgi:prophage regulatory protein
MVPAVLVREAAAVYAGLSVSTMENQVRKGQFPAPRQLSERRVGWLRADIDTWADALPVSSLPPGPGGRS